MNGEPGAPKFTISPRLFLEEGGELKHGERMPILGEDLAIIGYVTLHLFSPSNKHLRRMSVEVETIHGYSAEPVKIETDSLETAEDLIRDRLAKLIQEEGEKFIFKPLTFPSAEIIPGEYTLMDFNSNKIGHLVINSTFAEKETGRTQFVCTIVTVAGQTDTLIYPGTSTSELNTLLNTSLQLML